MRITVDIEHNHRKEIILDPKEFIQYMQWRVGYPDPEKMTLAQAIRIFAPDGNPVVVEANGHIRRGP